MKKIILIIALSFSSTLLAQRTISLNFDLYQNAANNIIALEGSFPLIYSGNVNGISYSFELEQPTVEFNQNFMKMIAILKINTTPTGYLELNLQPSIYVNYSLSTDNVTAFLQNFPNYINSTFPQLPQWVRDKIIEHYQSLQLTMYPVKILNYAGSIIPDYLDIEVSNINFSVQLFNGKFQIGIDFDVTGIQPFYQCYTYNHTKVKIKSNVRVDIKRLTVGDVLGGVYYDFNGTMPVAKNGEAIFNYYDQNNLATINSGRYIRVLLQSDVRGTFLRKYDASYMSNDGQWKGPKPVGVSFD